MVSLMFNISNFKLADDYVVKAQVSSTSKEWWQVNFGFPNKQSNLIYNFLISFNMGWYPSSST